VAPLEMLAEVKAVRFLFLAPLPFKLFMYIIDISNF